MASKYDYVDGKLVRFVQEDIADEAAVEAELRADLDAKQDYLNLAVAEQTSAEENYVTAEAAAEAASARLDEAKAAKEAAEADLAKSLDSKASYTRAIELRNTQPVDEASDRTGEDAEEVDGEATDVTNRITMAPAEG